MKRQIKITMTRRIFLFCFTLAFFSISSSAFAEWFVYKRAKIRNKGKDILTIGRSAGYPVRARLALKMKKPGIFSKRGLLYQVDQKEIRDVQKTKKIEFDKKKEHWISWQISDGETISAELRELMNGRQIVFQYYLPDGTIKETSFDLTGASEAIGEVIK